MSNEIATVMFVLVLALQVCVSGLGPIWAGAVIPALYGSLAGVTVSRIYGCPLEVSTQGQQESPPGL